MTAIFAIDESGAFGYENKLPWKCPSDLKHFKELTDGKTIVCGYNTFISLPRLKNKLVIVISKKERIEVSGNAFIQFRNIEDISFDKTNYSKILIIGGLKLLNYCFSRGIIKYVHLSVIKGEHKADCYFDRNHLTSFTIEKKEKRDGYDYSYLSHKQTSEHQYLSLCKELLTSKLYNSRNGNTLYKFGHTQTFDLRCGFPILTTKKMFIKGIIEELLFFIRGDTDSNILMDKKITIWKKNTDRKFLDSIGKTDRKEGLMGPMYGYNWRYFNADYDEETGKPCKKGHDQLQNLIDEIKANPYSRRHLLTTYNPAVAKCGVLYPCHSLMMQFNVEANLGSLYLDCICFNRSQDVFLGMPFNIASTSLFIFIIAKLTGTVPRVFTLNSGNTHIYESHIGAVRKQIARIPYKLPKLQMPEFKSLDELGKKTYKDFKFIEYKYHKTIKAEMVA